jgi:hypothetical protein
MVGGKLEIDVTEYAGKAVILGVSAKTVNSYLAPVSKPVMSMVCFAGALPALISIALYSWS